MSSNTTNSTNGFRESPGYKGNEVRDLNAALIAITTIIVGLRLYTRGFITRTLGLDDALASLAYIFIITQSALDLRFVSLGSGAHIQFVPGSLLRLFFSNLANSTFIFFIGTGLTRLSIVAFLPRLSKFQSFLFSKNGLTLTAIGIIVDVVLFALPIWVIHTKMMKSAKKVQVILVFSVGLFAVATGIVRMALLNSVLFLKDPTFEISGIGLWTDAEVHAGLWVVSFPALQPLIHKISVHLGLRNLLQSSTEGRG